MMSEVAQLESEEIYFVPPDLGQKRHKQKVILTQRGTSENLL